MNFISTIPTVARCLALGLALTGLVACDDGQTDTSNTVTTTAALEGVIVTEADMDYVTVDFEVIIQRDVRDIERPVRSFTPDSRPLPAYNEQGPMAHLQPYPVFMPRPAPIEGFRPGAVNPVGPDRGTQALPTRAANVDAVRSAERSPAPEFRPTALVFVEVYRDFASGPGSVPQAFGERASNLRIAATGIDATPARFADLPTADSYRGQGSERQGDIAQGPLRTVFNLMDICSEDLESCVSTVRLTVERPATAAAWPTDLRYEAWVELEGVDGPERVQVELRAL